MKSSFWLHLCLAVLFAGGIAQAAASSTDPRSNLLVDANWLDAHLHDPDLVLLHVGDETEYRKAHIPGARWVSQDELSWSEHTRDGLMLEMLPDEDLRARLEKLGISDNSRIVVYYGKDWVSPSTRVVFTLQYAGLGERTRLLDGGMRAWTAQGGATSKDTPPVQPGKLAALKVQPLIVDADYVRTHLDTPGVAVVDGRAAVYYDGVEVGGAHGQVHHKGHIRGARSVPFTTITDDQLRVRSTAELKALFEAAGIQPGDTVVGYCHIGQQATATLFAARLLGHPVRLYDGAFQDWSRRKDNPVETSTKRGQP
ncbi:MAG: sulfurtransferase [Rhodanobacteraceae bacterium]|nr:sulfurtransferase [Rhodanobacteraceae bacterium]